MRTPTGAPSAAAALVVLLLALCGCEPPTAPEVIRPVRAMKVGDATAIVGRRFPGRAKATEEVNLAFRVGGPLISLPINVGDKVEAGQVIARIDPRDFDVHVRNVKAQLQEAKANYTLASDEHERAQRAHVDGAVSDIELSRKLASRDVAAANVDALGASLQSAEDALADTQLRAPFAGRVVAKYVENFEDVLPKSAIVRILDSSKIEMIVDIPESLISIAPQAIEITCVFDRFPDVEVPAIIKEIGAEASATTRTFPVTLIMDQPEGIEILPGMTGIASGRRGAAADEGESADGYLIPIAAVASDDGDRSFVWVIDETTHTVSRREVTVGRVQAEGVVVQGIERGTLIAIAGVHYLRDGREVRVQDPSLDAEGSDPS